MCDRHHRASLENLNYPAAPLRVHSGATGCLGTRFGNHRPNEKLQGNRNDDISMEGIIQVALLDALILQIKSGGPEMLGCRGSHRACLPSSDSAEGCRPLRASQCLWVATGS